MAKAGAEVVVADVLDDVGRQTVEAILKAGGRAEYVHLDVTREEDWQIAIDLATAKFGRLDILVNNAGVFLTGPVGETTDEDHERQFAVNVHGVFAAVRAAAAVIADGGRIVSTGSVLGDRSPFPGGGGYSASKAAVAAFSRGWARDLAPRGVTVNVVQPGPVDTQMNPADGDFAPTLTAGTAFGRYGRPEEIAAAVVFLASPQASYITGTTLDVDGGYNA